MISRDSPLPIIKGSVKECLDKIYSLDNDILNRNNERGVCERSIVFRFAHYLQNSIPDFSVDCDFNSSYTTNIDLHENTPEEREGKSISNPDGTTTKRFIDIIVHKRDYILQNNFLCFEIKKWNNLRTKEVNKDKNNLKILTSKYQYIYGFHIIIHRIKTETRWTIYQTGRPIEENIVVFE